MNNDFLNAVCEQIYGDEFTKYDVKNILRNLKPAYEGTGILKFGTIKNSQYFMEFVIELWEQIQELRDQRKRYRKDLKTEKDHIKVCELLQQLKEECDNKILEMREQCNEIERGVLEDSSIHQKLIYDYRRLSNMYKEQENKLEDQYLLREKLSNSMIDNADVELKFKQFYQEKYKKEIEKFKKEYVRQDDKICNMELKNEIKLLKEELKKVKNQNTKFKKQILESMD